MLDQVFLPFSVYPEFVLLLSQQVQRLFQLKQSFNHPPNSVFSDFMNNRGDVLKIRFSQIHHEIPFSITFGRKRTDVTETTRLEAQQVKVGEFGWVKRRQEKFPFCQRVLGHFGVPRGVPEPQQENDDYYAEQDDNDDGACVH